MYPISIFNVCEDRVLTAVVLYSSASTFNCETIYVCTTEDLYCMTVFPQNLVCCQEGKSLYTPESSNYIVLNSCSGIQTVYEHLARLFEEEKKKNCYLAEIYGALLQRNCIDTIVNTLYQYTGCSVLLHTPTHLPISYRKHDKLKSFIWDISSQMDYPQKYKEKYFDAVGETEYFDGYSRAFSSTSPYIFRENYFAIWHTFAMPSPSGELKGFLMICNHRGEVLSEDCLEVFKTAADCIGFWLYIGQIESSKYKSIIKSLISRKSVDSAPLKHYLHPFNCLALWREQEISFHIIEELYMYFLHMETVIYEHFTYEGKRIILFSCESSKEIQHIQSLMKNIANKRKCHVGWGCNFSDPSELYNSYNYALDSYEIGHMLENEFFHEFSNNKLSILFQRANDVGGSNYYDDTFLFLDEYDKANGTQLCDTLFTYLSKNRSINLTCKQLFLHKNTVNYRINKIKSLTNYDFDSQDSVFHFLLSYRMKHSHGEKNRNKCNEN